MDLLATEMSIEVVIALLLQPINYSYHPLITLIAH